MVNAMPKFAANLLNTRDIPGFFLNRQDQAHHAIEDVGVSNLKVQMDLYHCQMNQHREEQAAAEHILRWKKSLFTKGQTSA
jgi:hydroxypyruvate isomerase